MNGGALTQTNVQVVFKPLEKQSCFASKNIEAQVREIKAKVMDRQALFSFIPPYLTCQSNPGLLSSTAGNPQPSFPRLCRYDSASVSFTCRCRQFEFAALSLSLFTAEWRPGMNNRGSFVVSSTYDG